MRISDLQSKLADQLYTCTDNYALQCAQPDFCCSAQAPTSATAADAAARSAPAWLPHRALQTMWQAGKCALGPGHGPKYYLSVSRYRQRPQMDYIPQDYYRQTTEYLANYQRLRQIVEEICTINRELLSRREEV